MTKKKSRDLCYQAYKVIRDHKKEPADKLNELVGIISEIDEINKQHQGPYTGTTKKK